MIHIRKKYKLKIDLNNDSTILLMDRRNTKSKYFDNNN